MYTIMYYACLRASEVLLTDTPQHMLTISQILFKDAASFQIQFTSYKHSNHQTPVLTVNRSDRRDCPVKALQEYIPLRGSAPGPLFLKDNSPISRQHFTKVFHNCLKYINLLPSSYNIHSFRIGRTTDMAQQNVPYPIIQQIGRWHSTAFMKYVRPQNVSTIPNPGNQAVVGLTS
jgi:hypothetical protein